jgi:hypothetical protein
MLGRGRSERSSGCRERLNRGCRQRLLPTQPCLWEERRHRCLWLVGEFVRGEPLRTSIVSKNPSRVRNLTLGCLMKPICYRGGRYWFYMISIRKIFQRRYDRRLRNAIGDSHNFFSSAANIASEGLQLPEQLPFIHNGRTSMFNKSSCNVIVGVSVMCLECLV